MIVAIYQKIMSTPSNLSKIIFQIWFGFGAPLYFLGLLAFYTHQPALCVFIICAYILRIADSFQKTCSRCPSYGSWQCGIPSKLVSVFLPKNNSSLSLKTIHQHMWVDFIFIGSAAFFYFLALGFKGLIVLVWPVGAYFIVYRNKRFHGLLWKIPSKK